MVHASTALSLHSKRAQHFARCDSLHVPSLPSAMNKHADRHSTAQLCRRFEHDVEKHMQEPARLTIAAFSYKCMQTGMALRGVAGASSTTWRSWRSMCRSRPS